MNSQDFTQNPSTLIRTASRLIRAEREDLLSTESIDRREVRALRRIAEGGPAAHGHRHPRSHRGAHLAHRGLIERTDEGVRITAEGTALLERVEQANAALDARIAASLSPEQLDALTTALTIVADDLGGTERLERVRTEQRRLRRAFRRGVMVGRGHGRGGHHGHGPHRGGFGPHREGFGPHREGEHGMARDCGHGHAGRPAH